MTATSSGLNNTVTGTPFDEEGDGFMVGVAVVEPTGDELIDLILSLPSDAVTQMPVNLAFSCMGWRQLQRALCPAGRLPSSTNATRSRDAARSTRPARPGVSAVTRAQRAAMTALKVRASEEAARRGVTYV